MPLFKEPKEPKFITIDKDPVLKSIRKRTNPKPKKEVKLLVVTFSC